ncbi:shikimate O-hydroxycinnamoyltransferase [Vigna unguiculata]|uniref:Shikimate O-hydroxycinnamoyltransferase n=1 Tax=Vigna unguiculata TaxID=3917 RepID=A0A4D6NB01_VIGUN|nr:shikimate O-hydroxycinnamoyltransferase [Vigna unguiculata]
MTISVKESIMVQPAEATPRKVLWNSDIDLLVRNYHTPTVYFYKPNGFQFLQRQHSETSSE